MKFPLCIALALSASLSGAVAAAPLATVVVSAPKSAAVSKSASKPATASKLIAASKTDSPRPAASGTAVDLNSADAATLAREMRGIGESKARAIVEYRRVHGPFRSIDDLALVKGIGAKTIDLNRTTLRLGSAAPSRSPAR